MYRRPALHLPADVPNGEPFFLMPKSAALKYDERCVTYAWLSDRPLFGEVYRQLLPDYFNAMPADGGVLIGSFIPIGDVVAGLTFPGDIDVLVIPYEGHELVLSHSLAIEIKVIRASFARQGKSPNQYGFSQACGLVVAGFPHVAVGHLIVSDSSPQDAWREMDIAKIIDAETGQCEIMPREMHDSLPSDLLIRAHGRLKRNCPDRLLGNFTAYTGGDGMWLPLAVRSDTNPQTETKVLDGIYDYYQKNQHYFMRTRKNPPPTDITMSALDKRERTRWMIKKMGRDFPNSVKTS